MCDCIGKPRRDSDGRLCTHEQADRDDDNVPSERPNPDVWVDAALSSRRPEPEQEATWATPAPQDTHEHRWVRKQNVTSSGHRMPPYEACECGAATLAPQDTSSDLEARAEQRAREAWEASISAVTEGPWESVGTVKRLSLIAKAREQVLVEDEDGAPLPGPVQEVIHDLLAEKNREQAALREEIARLNAALTDLSDSSRELRAMVLDQRATIARARDLAEKWDAEADAYKDERPAAARAVLYCSRDLRAALRGPKPTEDGAS